MRKPRSFDTLITHEGWMEDAACVTLRANPVVFDTVDDTNPTNPEFPYAKEALAFCHRCEVRTRCLGYALEHMKGYTGIVGGMKFLNGRPKGK